MPTTEQLAELGQAVLDEHRAVLLAEQNLTDPKLQAAAKEAAERLQELLRDA